MRFHKLRIAWLPLGAVSRVLLIVLWVRVIGRLIRCTSVGEIVPYNPFIGLDHGRFIGTTPRLSSRRHTPGRDEHDHEPHTFETPPGKLLDRREPW